MEKLQDDLLSLETELQIGHDISGYLIETSKWAKFIAIAIYVLSALGSICILVYLNYISDKFGAYARATMDRYFNMAILISSVFCIVVAVTYYFLIVFANKMRAGLETEDIEQVNSGLNGLKIHFIIIGILMLLGVIAGVYNLSPYF